VVTVCTIYSNIKKLQFSMQCIYLLCIFLRTVKRWNKAVRVHAMRAYTGSRGAASLSLNLSTWRWLVNSTPQPLYPQAQNPWHPLNLMPSGPHSLSEQFKEFADPWNVQPIAHTIYRPHYMDSCHNKQWLFSLIQFTH